MKQTETQLIDVTLEYLQCQGIKAWRQNTGGMEKRYTNKNGIEKKRFVKFGFKGVSDILGLIKPTGRLLAIECKVGDNKQTLHQQMFQKMIEQNGGLFILAYSLDDVIKSLEAKI